MYIIAWITLIIGFILASLSLFLGGYKKQHLVSSVLASISCIFLCVTSMLFFVSSSLGGK